MEVTSRPLHDSSRRYCPCNSVKKAQKDIDETTKRLHEGDLLMAKISINLENIEKKVDNLESKIDTQFDKFARDIEDLKLKPAKRWDGLVTVLISLFVGAIFGLVASNLGL